MCQKDMVPAETIHHRMEDPLIVGAPADEKIDIDGACCLLSLPINAAFPLLHSRGIPLEVKVHYVTAVGL